MTHGIIRSKHLITIGLVTAATMSCSLFMETPELKEDAAGAGRAGVASAGAGAKASSGLGGASKGGANSSMGQSSKTIVGATSGGAATTLSDVGYVGQGGVVGASGGFNGQGTAMTTVAVVTPSDGGTAGSVVNTTTMGGIAAGNGGATSSVANATIGGVGATGGAATGGRVATGGAATGGVVATGGTTQKLANGTSCSNKSQCDSGNCVDGYCCNAPCNGDCMTCSQTPGVCSMPATDTACIGKVSCPADTTCVDYTLTTTSGQCSSLGVCAQGCSQTYAPARTGCANSSDTNDGRICDGTGNCKQPQVACGAGVNAKTCDTAPGVCCRDWDPSSSTGNWVAGPTQCVTQTLSTPCESTMKRSIVTLRCDSPEDCASGKFCCLVQDTATERTSCLDKCTQSPYGTVGFSAVCRTDTDCPDPVGMACRARADFPEFKVCESRE